MPKLNVQQNNQNIIQAFKNALAIGNLKGIIASDGSHNFSTAGSNRNLLDNPWWGLNEVVNQRGNTSGQTTHNAYSIDRWKMSYGNALGTWSIAADGITITAASGTYAVFQQPLANPSALLGKTVTCSILFADGTIASRTVENVTWTGNPVVFTYGYARVQLLNEGTFRVTILNGGSETIRAVKLELGSVSTLANDAPPDYGEELAKCQRYFTRWYSTAGSSAIGLALAVGTTNANFAMLSNLRAEGSATISFTGLVLSDGTDKTVTNVSVAGAGDGKSMRLLVTSSGLTAYRSYVLQITAGGHLDVSKDL